MPGFDGTGPVGRGPMTGRGRGYCIQDVSIDSNAGQGPATGRPPARRQGRRGRGMGPGFGTQKGTGRSIVSGGSTGRGRDK